MKDIKLSKISKLSMREYLKPSTIDLGIETEGVICASKAKINNESFSEEEMFNW